jgi:hypothetical protein
LKVAPPLEKHEQMALAGWLDAIGVLWMHVPNERMVNHLPNALSRMNYIKSLKRQGMKNGVPDNFIFTVAPLNVKPTALELKRIGENPTKDQQMWLDALHMEGWNAGWFQGFDAAYTWLKSLGYGVR